MWYNASQHHRMQAMKHAHLDSILFIIPLLTHPKGVGVAEELWLEVSEHGQCCKTSVVVHWPVVLEDFQEEVQRVCVCVHHTCEGRDMRS